MDEVDLMRGIGADVPAADVEARARARSRLEASIAGEATPLQRGSERIARSRRRVFAAAAIVALVAMVLFAQAILPPGTGGLTAAQATLGELAAVAATRETTSLASGQFFYVRTTSVVLRAQKDLLSGTNWTIVVRVQREKWLASDGSGTIVERFGTPRFLTPKDREIWLRAGSPRLLPHGPGYSRVFGPGELAPLDLGALPRDPGALARLIESGGAGGTSTGTVGSPLDTVADLLGEAPATADLRSALFNATAQLPGIVTREGVKDPAGRAGVSVSLVRDGVRTELIFDAESSALLARIVTQLDGEGHPIQVLERSTYVERGVVDSATARP
jgi:hypothetical protein